MPPSSLHSLLSQALARRLPLLSTTQAFRAFSGIADGLDGVYLDVYGQGATLITHEGKPPRDFDLTAAARTALETLSSIGVRAIYHKPFAKDRSRLGGELPPITTSPTPLAGEPLPESLLIRESDWSLEVRLYDGLSTGLFLDQRDNRIFINRHIARLRAQSPTTILNTFAYTCAFSIAAARAGAITTSVDVSARYLDWGKRNFTHNSLDPAAHRFAKMDTFDFLGYALKKSLRYDVIILDPPSFSAGSRKKGIRPWSSLADYARLIAEASKVLAPGGLILASTNTQELCRPGRLEREVIKALGKPPRWIKLPQPPVDFARDRDRFAALAFALDSAPAGIAPGGEPKSRSR